MVRGIKSGTKQIADYINLNKLSTKVDRYPYKSVIWANKFQYIHTHTQFHEHRRGENSFCVRLLDRRQMHTQDKYLCPKKKLL